MLKLKAKQKNYIDELFKEDYTISTKNAILFEKISDILDKHPEILQRVWESMNGSLENGPGDNQSPIIGKSQPVRGSCITAEQILRMLIYMKTLQLSYRMLEQYLHENLVAKNFTRIHSQKVPHYTTIQKWVSRISPEVVVEINRILCESPEVLPSTPGRKKDRALRVDCTAVEANIAPPSDSRLLAKGVELLVRYGLRFCSEESWRCLSFPNPEVKAHRFCKQIHTFHGQGAATNRIGKYKLLMELVRDLLAAGLPLIQILEDSLKNCLPTALSENLIYFYGYYWLLEKVLRQAESRILHNQQVKASEKVVSFFETHTDIICTGKKKDPVFGHKILLAENEYGLIEYYQVLRGNPNDATLVSQLVEEHLKERGIKKITFDRGFYSRSNQEILEEAGIEQVCLPKRGYKSKEVMAKERQPRFKSLRKWRSGIEGRISHLKRDYGLRRCPLKGWEHFQLHVGFSIFCHNLVKAAKLALEAEDRKRKRKYGGKKAA